MAINFPNNPAVNDTFTVGGINFTFTGVKWESGAVVEISSDTTPSLGGDLDGGAKNINNVGVITATTFSGNLTGNVTGTATTATYAQTAGISNYASTAGVSTYASTAGVSTNAQGLTGTPNITVGTVTGTDATFSGNLTVNGTTTTIDTAITSVDSIAVDGAGTFGSTVRVNHTGNAGSDQLVRLGNVNNSGTNSAHLFLANGYYVSPTDVDGTAAAAKILADGTIHDSMGPLRRLGINAQTGAYTVTTTDAGKLIRINNVGNITIPTGLSPGDMVSIVSHHNSTNTIVQGSGLTLYNTADGSSGNRTLAARGVCTILWSHTDTAYISGSGLT